MPGRSGALPVGSQLQGGKYVVEAVLGEGSFGITYRAAHTGSRLHQQVAIKELFVEGSTRAAAGRVLHPPGRSDESWGRLTANFEREAQTLARLKHPGIVTVYDCFGENDTLYIVMELVDGTNLDRLVRQRGGHLAEAEALRYVTEVAAALSVLHANGVLHRDIKPANIMIDKSDHAVLIDFGTARDFVPDKTLTHSVVLTPAFAPPEQFQPRARRGPFTDIYALAATAYWLLTGDLLDMWDTGKVKDDTRLSPRLRTALSHALAFNPADRTPDAARFITELSAQTPIAAPPVRQFDPNALTEPNRPAYADKTIIEPNQPFDDQRYIAEAKRRRRRLLVPLLGGSLAAGVLLVTLAVLLLGGRGSAGGGASATPVVAASTPTFLLAPATPDVPTVAPATSVANNSGLNIPTIANPNSTESANYGQTPNCVGYAAKVDNETIGCDIYLGYVKSKDDAYKQQYGSMFNFDSPPGRRALEVLHSDALDELIDNEVAVLEAPKEGVTPPKDYIDQLMAKARPAQFTTDADWEKSLEANGSSMAEVRHYLEKGYLLDQMTKKHGTAATQELWLQAAHIVVSDQTLANNIYQQIQAGGDFAALAKQYSTDGLTKDKGGLVGFINPNNVDQATAAVLKSLKDGETAKPFGTRKGWEIIRVLKRELRPIQDQTSLTEQGIADFQTWVRPLWKNHTIVKNITFLPTITPDMSKVPPTFTPYPGQGTPAGITGLGSGVPAPVQTQGP